MKSRHAAVLALVGWYLMVPPWESCNGALSGGPCNRPPLVKWRIAQPYDSLSKCEEVKAEWLEKGKMYLAESEVRNRSRTSRMRLDEADATKDMLATCVASDDPRLKEK